MKSFELHLKAPKGYLELLDQPAVIIPKTLKDDTANNR